MWQREIQIRSSVYFLAADGDTKENVLAIRSRVESEDGALKTVWLPAQWNFNRGALRKHRLVGDI